MRCVRKVLRFINGPAPPVTAAWVVLLVVCRVSHDLVALVALVGQELLQGDDSSHQQGNLGEDDGLGCGEGDDSEEERDQGGDLELSDGQKGQELLDLLLLATGCEGGGVQMRLCGDNYMITTMNVGFYTVKLCTDVLIINQGGSNLR